MYYVPGGGHIILKNGILRDIFDGRRRLQNKGLLSRIFVLLLLLVVKWSDVRELLGIKKGRTFAGRVDGEHSNGRSGQPYWTEKGREGEVCICEKKGRD